MTDILEAVNAFVWGIPALLLILGVGIYLTVRTGFAQFRLLPKAAKNLFNSFQSGGEQEKSSAKALCTALAATVGTGNIAGVAGAIAIGGPGSIFWMWICALLGMVIKFAEAALSVRFSRRLPDGTRLGGPMYMIEIGMGKRWRWLGICYCMFGVIAAFGMGNATQINAVIHSTNLALAFFGGGETVLGNLLIGAGLALLAGACLLGGARRIGNVAVMLVPLASVGYILLSIGALGVHWRQIPSALGAILTGAFSPEAVTGGVIGTVAVALRVGASRGVFTNEAGMGTAAIAHGESVVKEPLQQGLMGIMEVFLDTIVICTMTALVILTSGVSIPYGLDEGAILTTKAFVCTYGDWVSILLAAFLCCFAFATMLGWGLYGLRCAQYLFGEKSWRGFVFVQMGASAASVLLGTGTVWLLSETVNGLMAIPNLIVLLALSPALFSMIRKESA